MRGMYLHAERLLAKAGRQGAREGYRPPERSGGKRSAVIFTKEKLWGHPCRRARAAPSARLGFLMRARQRTGIFRVALRQEQAAVVGSEECGAVAAREDTPPVDGELP
jgi:hypothetical protein